MTINLPGGGRVEGFTPGMSDRDTVTLITAAGQRRAVRWGTVIAMTNGEVLDHLPAPPRSP